MFDLLKLEQGQPKTAEVVELSKEPNTDLTGDSDMIGRRPTVFVFLHLQNKSNKSKMPVSHAPLVIHLDSCIKPY